MTDAAPDCTIRTIDLTMIYRSSRVAVTALQDVNLTVCPGEFVAIMGPSGCGKSTLLHVLGGLLQPSSGRIFIDGMDISALTDSERTAIRREKIGFVFQRFNLLPAISAKANIDLAKRIHRNGQLNSSYGTDEIVNMLGLQERIRFRPTELSGGEQQRVAIARAVINKPSIVLADEPTGSLDSHNARIVLRILQDLNERLRQTVVMITHDPEAAAAAKRIVKMRDGQILSSASQVSYESEFEGLF